MGKNLSWLPVWGELRRGRSSEIPCRWGEVLLDVVGEVLVKLGVSDCVRQPVKGADGDTAGRLGGAGNEGETTMPEDVGGEGVAECVRLFAEVDLDGIRSPTADELDGVR